MNVVAKLAGFFSLLAAVFGVAFLTGTQSAALIAPPEIHSTDLGGVSASVAGYTLSAVEPKLEPGKDQFVELTLTGPDGGPVDELDEVDGAPMHLVAVRRDLTGFQLIFPAQGEKSSWWALLNLSPGPWHIVLELQPTALGRRITLGTDFMVLGDYRPEPLPAPADSVAVNGLDVKRSGPLTIGSAARTRFTVTQGGQPVTDLQPVHGGLGHAVVLRPDDLGYLHLHSLPTVGGGPDIEFEGGVPSRGTYRVFVEFYRGERAYVAAYTEQVGR